jgi:PAS domain S-box-containing protein
MKDSVTTNPSFVAQRSKILLVDDIEENLVALEALLRRDDAEVLIAHSGNEALELILLHEFSLALVDVQMPEMDGFELAELMRGTERSKYIPIIFVTAGAGDALRVFRGYESGAVDFLFKPIDSHILRQKADTFIRLDQQKKQLAAQYARIQENEALLRAMMDATSALISVKDLAGRYVTVNKQYRDLLAVNPGPERGSTDFDFFPSALAEVLRANDAQALSHGAAIQVEEQFDLPDGTRTFLANKVPLRNAQGAIWGVCAIATDITEIKRMEAELEQAIQAREDVLAVVSHDIRNFLQAIRSGVLMLATRKDSLSEDVRNMIYDRIKITVDLMTRMIADLMDMANIRMGRIAVSMRPEVISNLIREAIVVHEPLAHDKGIAIGSQIEAADDMVECDRERVLQVLANILGNAIKFCEGGRIDVNVARHGEHLQVSVADSGPGIAAEHLPHVFDPYWSGSDNGRGTGLGLYITKRIMDAHGTKIWIESSLGVGTTVHFCLPLAKNEGREPRAAA